MIVVVDACVVVKWYVPEEFVAEADLLAGDNFDLHAPELILPEFGSITPWRSTRRAYPPNAISAAIASTSRSESQVTNVTGKLTAKAGLPSHCTRCA